MTPNVESAQVVVADDDLLFSSAIAASLERLGYRAAVVRTAAALETSLRDGPRAIIMNLAARGFDAAAVIRRLKAGAATQGIPVLGFCGHRDIERARAAKTAGCDAVTTNGVVAADLPRALAALLDSPRPPTGTA